MFPMGFYDSYGLDYGLGFGMMPSVIPSPPALNSQGDTNAYVSHHSEGGIDPTVALLSFAALSALGGLLLARKMNKTDKLVRIVKSEANKAAEAARNLALKDTEAAKVEAGNVRKAALEDHAATVSAGQEIAQAHIQDGIAQVDQYAQQVRANLAEEVGAINEELVGRQDLVSQGEAALAKGRAELEETKRKLASNPIHKTQPGFANPIDAAARKAAERAAREATRAAQEELGTIHGIHKKGHGALLEGKYDEAMPFFQQVIEICERNLPHLNENQAKLYHGNYSAALHNYGLCHKANGNLDEAVECFQKAIKYDVDKKFPGSWNQLAECRHQQGNIEEAIKCYEEAANAGDSSAMFMTAAFKCDKAKTITGNARILGKSAVDTAKATVEADKLYKEAAVWYDKAAKKGNHDAKYYLAELYEKGLGVGKSDVEAVKLYKEALEYYVGIAQGNPIALEQLRNTKVKLGYYKTAAETGQLGVDPKVKDLLVGDDFDKLLKRAQDLYDTETFKPGKSGANPTGKAASHDSHPGVDLANPEGTFETQLDKSKTQPRGFDAKVGMWDGKPIDPNNAARQPLAPASVAAPVDKEAKAATGSNESSDTAFDKKPSFDKELAPEAHASEGEAPSGKQVIDNEAVIPRGDDNVAPRPEEPVRAEQPAQPPADAALADVHKQDTVVDDVHLFEEELPPDAPRTAESEVLLRDTAIQSPEQQLALAKSTIPINQLIANAKAGVPEAVSELGNRYTTAICDKSFASLPIDKKLRRCSVALNFIEKGTNSNQVFDNVVAIREVLAGERNEAFQPLLARIEKIMEDLVDKAI